jgi:ethanolamine utilization microcompartment shell protein EutS
MIELTQQEKDTLAKLITKDNEAIFEKIGVKRDKNPIGVLQNDTHAKEEISKYIIAAELTPSVIGKNELINRAFVMDNRYSNKYKFVLHEKDGLQVLAIEEK